MECQVKEPFESSQIGYKSQRQGNKHAMSWQHFVIRNKKQFAEDKTLSQFSFSSRSSTSRSSTPSLCLCYIKCQLIWCTSMQTYIRANICLNLWWFNEWGFVERLKIYIILRLAKKNLILGVDKLTKREPWGTDHRGSQHETVHEMPSIHPPTTSHKNNCSQYWTKCTLYGIALSRDSDKDKNKDTDKDKDNGTNSDSRVTSHDCCHHWS